MNSKRIATTFVGVIIAIVAYASTPTTVVSQTPAPADLRLTAAAIRVETAADNARAQALLNQAKEIEKNIAKATAEQKKVEATATALQQEADRLATIAARPTETPLPTLTPIPSATSNATATPIPPVIQYVDRAGASPASAQTIGEGQPASQTPPAAPNPVLVVGIVILVIVIAGVAIRLLLVQMAKGAQAGSELRERKLDEFSRRMDEIRRRK